MERVILDAFFDEFCKLAASKERWNVPKARSGRRSMSVDTMLRKEKDGTLYKQTPHAHGRLKVPAEEVKVAGEIIRAGCGDEMEYKLRKAGLYKEEPKGKLAAAVTEQANATFQEVDPKNPTVTPPVVRQRGDTPSRDDIPGRTGAEYRQDVSGSTASRGMAPEGYST